MIQDIELSKLSIKQLIQISLELPKDSFVEVYFDESKKNISFSNALYGGSYSSNRFSVLHQRNWNDFSGVYLRKDQKIELENMGNIPGEFYANVKLVDKRHAIDYIACNIITRLDEITILFDKITRKMSLLGYFS